MLAQLAARAAVLIATLTLTGHGAAAALHGVEARRSSLLGYEVGGCIWEAEDAARALAYEVGKAVVAEQPVLPGLDVAVPVVAAQLHPDLLRGPVQSFGVWSETWFAGAAANRRIYALRTALLSERVEQAKVPPTGFTIEDEQVRIRYTVPAGVAVPAIEVV